MLIQRPQTSIWKQHNPVAPDATPSPLSPKPWLEQDSGGAVGLGIVAALHKSIVNTAALEIIHSRPAECREDSRRHDRNNNERWRGEGLSCRSPPRSNNKKILVPAADFLSHCSSCRKQLHGKDVYMYHEKAFCSIDCRYQQIVSDELQEKSRRLKMSKRSCSPCSSHGRFFTGVVAAKGLKDEHDLYLV